MNCEIWFLRVWLQYIENFIFKSCKTFHVSKINQFPILVLDPVNHHFLHIVIHCKFDDAKNLLS